jgi:hypothetical protein
MKVPSPCHRCAMAKTSRARHRRRRDRGLTRETEYSPIHDSTRARAGGEKGAAHVSLGLAPKNRTVTGGRIAYGAGPFEGSAPALLPVQPAWSPVAEFGGYYRGS